MIELEVEGIGILRNRVGEKPAQRFETKGSSFQSVKPLAFPPLNVMVTC